MYKKFYRTKNYSDSLFLDITSSKKKKKLLLCL